MASTIVAWIDDIPQAGTGPSSATGSLVEINANYTTNIVSLDQSNVNGLTSALEIVYRKVCQNNGLECTNITCIPPVDWVCPELNRYSQFNGTGEAWTQDF